MLLPSEARLVEDPFGVAFSSPKIAKHLQEARAIPRWAKLPGLGDFVLYMQVRTRVLDDAVRAFAASGGRQLVLLGAGYDCRALRLGAELGLSVFEVDHPATQGHKRRVLDGLGRPSPARYLEWHFEERPMAELAGALGAVGHERGAPSLTLWEGVTMYLTEPAIDASVRAIADYSAPGSQLAMTYLVGSGIQKPSLTTRAIQAVVATAGEPWRWGWEPTELPAWLAVRGFSLNRDASIATEAERLLPPDYARRVEDPTRRFAVGARESVAVAGK